MRFAAVLAMLLGLGLTGAACTGGTYITFPTFPDASCLTCSPDDRRPN